MEKRRLKHGEWIAMSPEDKLKWKRHLQKRWRHNNPEYTKRQNQYYAELYRSTKPFLPICKVCNEPFHAPRSCYKICPDCKIKIHERRVAKQNKKTRNGELRRAQIEEIINLWKSGMSQNKIAKIYKRTQSGISALLRRKGIIKKSLKTKK